MPKGTGGLERVFEVGIPANVTVEDLKWCWRAVLALHGHIANEVARLERLAGFGAAGAAAQAGMMRDALKVLDGVKGPDGGGNVPAPIAMLAGFHGNSACGCCGGPLEEYRDAVCKRCTLDMELRDALRENEALRDRVRHERSMWCDNPDDRMYRAKDGTWWRRDKDGRCVAADPPARLQSHLGGLDSAS